MLPAPATVVPETRVEVRVSEHRDSPASCRCAGRNGLAPGSRGDEPDARPAELLTPAYWVDLISEAERGHLDFVTVHDALALQPDGVQGRLDAVLIAARVAPLHPAHRSAAHRSRHPHRAVPPVEGDRDPGLRQFRSRRSAGASSTARPDAAAPLRQAPGSRVSRAELPTFRRGRRLRRGAPPAVGQLGGRRRDPRRRHRPLHRPRQAALHRLRGRSASPSAAPRSRRGRRRASRSSPRSRTATSPSGWSRPSRRHRLRHAARRRGEAADRRDDRAEQRRRRARRDDRARLRRPRGLPRRRRRGRRRAQARLDDHADGRVHQRRRTCSSGPRPSSPTSLWTGRRAGLSGFRLRPATLPHDLTQITARPRPRTAAPRPVPQPLRGRHPARTLGLARPANRYAAA